ncbi:MAG: type II secretion system protein M [Synergistaceae bacterium]|nr:type II secretion system protein M [Synergistaceae bacterium]MBR0204978.1 type II secretion system protein M [Synergistaceae bacterium]
MAVNIDSLINNAKTVFRGEAPGSIKFIVVLLLTLIIWVGVMSVNGWTAQAQTGLNTQQSRWKTLLMLADEYKAIAPTSNNNANQNVDVPAVFAQVSERMQLGSRVNRITPDGRNQSIELNRLYAEELAEFQTLLAAKGVRIIAMELRALPAGRERLMTVTAIIGPVN